MADIDELHEEFEALIGELEKLKTINHLATENSEALVKVLERINELAQLTDEKLIDFYDSAEKVKKGVSTTVQSQKKILSELEGVIPEINKVLLNKNKKLEQAIDSKLNGFERDTDQFFKKNKELLDTSLLEFQNIAGKTNDTMTDFGKEISIRLDSKFQDFENKLDASVQNISNKYDAKSDKLEAKIIENKKTTEDGVNYVEKYFNKSFKKIEGYLMIILLLIVSLLTYQIFWT